MAKRRLTERQKGRIAAIQQRRRERFEQRADAALDDSGANQAQSGQVVIRHGQNLVISDTDGTLHHCLSRQNIGQPVCGDRVLWQPTHSGEGVVTALQPRDTALVRPDYSGREKPLAANLTQLVVVLAPQPTPSAYLLDQYLVAAELIGVATLITLNKSDLLDDATRAEFDDEFGRYRQIGYPLIEVSARHDHGLDPLIERLADQTSILVGQSGVGKSSLVGALLPDIEIQIGRLSEASGLGRHTTSTTRLYRLPQGGTLIDSPGVRSFRLGRLTQQQLEQGFREFHPYLGQCRFSDCSHDHEPGCALREAVERGEIHPQRLANFRHLVENTPKNYY